MDNKQSTKLALVLLTLSGCSFGAWAATYVVEIGDTLSKIALRKIGKPIYSKFGSLKKLLSANPDIKNPDRIYPGQRVNLDIDPAQEDSSLHAEDQSVKIVEDTSEANVAESASQSSKDEIAFQVGSSFAKVVATDRETGANSKVFSNIVPEFIFSWTRRWSDTWQSFFRFRYLFDSFQQPSSRSLDKSKESIYDVSAGVRRYLNPKLSLGAAFTYGQEFFVRNQNVDVMSLDRVNIPRMTLGAQWEFLKTENISSGLAFNMSYLFGASASAGYSVDSGTAYMGSLYFKKALPFWNLSLLAEAYYQKRNQNSSLSKQSEDDLGANVGLSWRAKQ